jgi:hypothetical protein
MPSVVAPVDIPTVVPTAAQTELCPSDQCCVSGAVEQCPALFAATNIQFTCACYNFCDGVFNSCSEFGAVYNIDCAQNLVAGCTAPESTIVPTAAPPTDAPTAIPTTADPVTPTIMPSVVAQTSIPTAAPTSVLTPDQPTTSPTSAVTEIPKQCLIMVSDDQCSNLMATEDAKEAICDCYNFCNGEVSCCTFDEPCPIDCTGDFVAGCRAPKPTTCAVTVGNAQCGPLVAQQTPILDCDCYHYCNGEFVGCTEYGDFGDFICDGNAVAGCEIEEPPIGECAVVANPAACGPLVETQQTVGDCDCYNYCDGSYLGCCPYGQYCPISGCDGGLFVAGCELGGAPTSPAPTPRAPVGTSPAPTPQAPVGSPRQPFFFWPDGFSGGDNNNPDPRPPPTTSRPTAPTTQRPTRAPTPKQPFFFLPDGW